MLIKILIYRVITLIAWSIHFTRLARLCTCLQIVIYNTDDVWSQSILVLRGSFLQLWSIIISAGDIDNFNSSLSSKTPVDDATKKMHRHTSKFISIRHSTLLKKQTKFRGISCCYCYLTMFFTKRMTTFRRQRTDIWILCFTKSWNYHWYFPHAVSITKLPVAIGNIQLTTTCEKSLTITQCFRDDLSNLYNALMGQTYERGLV